MFTYSERDMHRMPAPIKTHLPIKTDILNSGIMEEDAAGRENEADPNLSRLPAPALHGTFAKAYSLLTRLASKIGWDDLLKCRSQVFVMEEEYRMQKAKEDIQKSSVSINGDAENEAQDTADTTEATEDTEGQPKVEATENTEEQINSEADKDEKEEGEIVGKMETIDLNGDENKASTPIQVQHTPLVRPKQVAEDKPNVRNKSV